jgi:succinoglycan biosynthesis protein ExoM
MTDRSAMSHISVCICTYKRPVLLAQLLKELSCQKTDGLFSYSIVVVDNDSEQSAKSAVMSFAANSPIETTYLVEQISNIALARNKAVNNAKGDYLAFIDDDELPANDWLLIMLNTIKAAGADGVLAPVLPSYEVEPPRWVVQAGFYDRPRHQTGFVLGWQEARTGNVLLRRAILDGTGEPFRAEFGTGGEDVDFFRRMMTKGYTFIWCDEAPVYEVIPPHRWERRFLIKRALLRGEISSRRGEGLLRNLIKAVIAVPVYSLALPVLLLLGQHLFMKYLIRMFDHLGRLLAVFHLNPMRERCH